MQSHMGNNCGFDSHSVVPVKMFKILFISEPHFNIHRQKKHNLSKHFFYYLGQCQSPGSFLISTTLLPTTLFWDISTF